MKKDNQKSEDRNQNRDDIGQSTDDPITNTEASHDSTEQQGNSETVQQNVDLESQLNDEKNRRLRLMADFENYKKQVEQEKAMFGAIANMGLIQGILEVADDIQLALDDAELDLDRAKHSLANAQEKVKSVVRLAGVEAVEVKVGDEFNKEKMEAIQAIPDEKNKNKVIAVISAAYKYSNKDGILKPAKVIVGK